MTVEFWIGQDFETSHERSAFFQLLKLMEEKFGTRQETYFICANHFLGGNQIDLTVIKEDAIVVVELKECDQPFRATENGNWITFHNKYILGTAGENPFEQVTKYRKLWMDYLKENESRFLPRTKFSTMEFTHISAMVVISPRLHEKTIKDFSPRVSKWFQLVGLDEFHISIGNQTSRRLNFTDQEIRKLIEIMNLRVGDKSLGLTNAPRIVPRFGRIPPIPPLLVGRESALLELKNRLGVIGKNGKRAQSSTQVMTAMRGWPGVGKTTLAAALAHDPEIDKAFPDGLLWASLGEKPNIFTELEKWAKCLVENISKDVKTSDELRSIISTDLKNKRMLLVVDDVWEIADAEYFRVGGKNCATLFTTRIPIIAEGLAPTEDDVYLLPVLDSMHSLELLEIIAPSIVRSFPTECEALVSELEGLPLALQVAGRLLNAEKRRGKNIIDFLSELREGAKLIEAQAPSDRIDLVRQTTPTIAALLNKSTDRLDPETRERFAYLGAFAPKPCTFDLDDVKDIWDIDDPRPTIDILLDMGLLESANELYQMHSLLVMLAKSILS